jgi:alpha-ketoglutarate-dependent taurine dioxygenase
MSQLNYHSSISFLILFFFAWPQISLRGGELWKNSVVQRRSDKILTESGLIIEPKEPFGVVVTCAVAQRCSNLRALSSETYAWLKVLAMEHGHVLLRNFTSLEPEAMEVAARRFGPLLKWKFGYTFHVKPSDDPQTTVDSRGKV